MKKIYSFPLFTIVGLVLEIIGWAAEIFLIISPLIFPLNNFPIIEQVLTIFLYFLAIRFLGGLLIVLCVFINRIGCYVFFDKEKKIITRKSFFKGYVRSISFGDVREIVRYCDTGERHHFLVIIDRFNGSIKDSKDNSFIRISNTPYNVQYLKSIGFIISPKDEINMPKKKNFLIGCYIR